VSDALDSPPPQSLTALMDEIGASASIPVRRMQRVLRAGQAAVGPVRDALECWDGESRDPLWAVVLAGELRDASAIEPLRARLVHPSLDFLAIAAAEALAKIGRPALPVLEDLARSEVALVRLHAYGAAGWIVDDGAYTLLLDALGSDHELADVIANAIVEHRRTDALPALWAAYRNCAPGSAPTSLTPSETCTPAGGRTRRS